VQNQVNTATAGNYTVTYNVKDAAGHAAPAVIRTVKVIAAGTATNPGEPIQLPLSGGTEAVQIASAGEVISQFSAVATSGTPPAGIRIPLGIVSYTTTVPAGASSQTVNLTFSSPLPANFVLYKVDNAGVYLTIPNGAGVDQWMQVGTKTIALTLSDGGPFDLGGPTPDGKIIDPVAVGTVAGPTISIPASLSAGGCSVGSSRNGVDPLMPALILLSLGWLAMRRRQANNPALRCER